jgi:hypothetical protein
LRGTVNARGVAAVYVGRVGGGAVAAAARPCERGREDKRAHRSTPSHHLPHQDLSIRQRRREPARGDDSPGASSKSCAETRERMLVRQTVHWRMTNAADVIVKPVELRRGGDSAAPEAYVGRGIEVTWLPTRRTAPWLSQSDFCCHVRPDFLRGSEPFVACDVTPRSLRRHKHRYAVDTKYAHGRGPRSPTMRRRSCAVPEVSDVEFDVLGSGAARRTHRALSWSAPRWRSWADPPGRIISGVRGAGC